MEDFCILLMLIYEWLSGQKCGNEIISFGLYYPIFKHDSLL